MSTSYLNRLGAIDFSRTIERLAEGFTGREWLFDKLDNWLQQEDGEMFYLLTGEPGVGKSAIAARLTQRWANDEPVKSRLAAYHFCRAGDVETVRPGRVLRSLATQLGKTLPHYGEALKEVLDQVHMRIDVNINIDRLSNSQVTGIYVENLKDLDPREEFRLLIQAPLTALSKIYTTLGETPPALKVFLIDSLDEAATTTGQENMVTLLASLYQAREALPPWVRFLLTVRPNQDVLNRFLPLKSEKIEELEDDNLDDIQEYVQGRVGEQLREERSTPEPQTSNAIVTNPKSLQQRLEKAELTAEKLVVEVKELSHGNFLYTKLLLNSIASGEQSIKNLSALPKDLNEIYHRILRYRCSFRGWLKRYQPILGTLSVTQEPISQAHLGKFTRIKAEELEKNLAVFRQFLDESKDEQGQPLYTIFHQSLREYLLDKKHNHDFWCDAKEQHDGIIDCFENESEGWQNLRAIDLYGLRYLVQHLVKGDRVEELHTLLSLEKDGKNAWFKVKDDVAETAGFLADVDLAWARVEEEPDRESGRTIALQFRYALMIASVTSLAKIIPIELLINLVEKGVWVSDKGLSYALQNPDLKQRVEALINLAAYLSPFLKEKALQEVLNIAQENPYWSNLNGILRNLLPHLSDPLLPKALNLARSIQNESSRASALIALVPHIPGILPEALQTARSVQHGAERVRFLISLLPHLPDILPTDIQAPTDQYAVPTSDLIALATHLPETLLIQALEASQAIQDVSDRAKFLTALIPKLPEALPEALQAAQAIQDDYSQFQALAALISHMPQILPQALQVARSIQDPYSHTKALIALIPYRSETVFEAAESAQFIESKGYYVDALADLLPYQPEIAQEAFQVAQEIQDDISRSLTLGLLIPKLPETFFLQAFKESLSRQDHSRITILYGVVPRLPEAVLGEAFNAAQAIKEPSEREFVLSLLASRLPEAFQEAFMLLENRGSTLASDLRIDLLPEAIEKAQTIQNESIRADFLEGLAPRILKSSLPRFLEVAQTIQGETNRLKVLTALPSSLQEETVLLERLRLVQVIHDESEQAQVLLSLAPYASEILSKALLVVPLIQSEYSRNAALGTLARELPGFALSEAISATRIIQDETSRAIFLNALISRLTEDLLFEAFEIAQTVQGSPYGARTLIALASMLPESLISKALKSAQRIYDGLDRLEFLINLAPKLPEFLIPESIEIVRDTQGIHYESSYASKRAEFLVALAPRLQESSLPTVLEIVQSIQSYSSGAEVLIALLPYMPQVFPNALSAIRSIQYGVNIDYYRAKCLTALIPFSREVFSEALEAFRVIQRAEDYFYILLDLAPYQPEILWQEALSICRKTDFDSDKMKLLKILIPRLPEKLQPEAFQIARAFQDESDRVEALTVLIPYIPEALDEAFQTARAIQDKSDRAEALTVLIPYIPEALDEAFQTARAIQDESDRAKALTVLIPYMPEALSDAIEASRTIRTSGYYGRPPEYYRAKALLALLCYKPEIFPEVLELTQAISD